MGDTLIVYGTRRGASEVSAGVIKDILEGEFGLDVDVFNVKQLDKKFSLEPYANVIVGASIALGRWARRAKKFLGKNDFAGKKLAIFISSGFAGEALKEGNEKKYEKAMEDYMTPVVQDFHLDPVSTKGLGGWWKKDVTDSDSYNWNRDDVEAWARTLGKIFVG
ncbi:hypothetical protein GF325_05180 [Candidatus Bathyarchaeota archaeon]|nr:hypothetical protein [Candidatus Bathyarchaeota archaeon]